MQTLTLDLAERSYPIYIGEDLVTQGGLLERHLAGRQAFIVSNDTVAPLYLGPLKESLERAGKLQVDTQILPDGESHKTLETLGRIFDGLLRAGHNRTTTVIALGGGVVGDMAGFAAACYQRGVDFIQVPTTLLAMVDSSVGGKTGVNHPLGKNMIGAFHQPRAVIADMRVLQSLPAREISAGLAEVIKYGLIADKTFFNWLEANIAELLARDPKALAYAVKHSCENKARIVAQDEREAGLRATLNLGHTFGHAIETHQGYGNWLHGEAVAAGMVMALDLSRRRGAIGKEDFKRLVRLLERAHLPVKAPADMTADDFLRLMGQDKKVTHGQLRLVLLESMGRAIVTSDIDMGQLKKTFAACRAVTDQAPPGA